MRMRSSGAVMRPLQPWLRHPVAQASMSMAPCRVMRSAACSASISSSALTATTAPPRRIPSAKTWASPSGTPHAMRPPTGPPLMSISSRSKAASARARIRPRAWCASFTNAATMYIESSFQTPRSKGHAALAPQSPFDTGGHLWRGELPRRVEEEREVIGQDLLRMDHVGCVPPDLLVEPFEALGGQAFIAHPATFTASFDGQPRRARVRAEPLRRGDFVGCKMHERHHFTARQSNRVALFGLVRIGEAKLGEHRATRGARRAGA